MMPNGMAIALPRKAGMRYPFDSAAPDYDVLELEHSGG
jgi:hypothetical protein